eukprot:m.232642 g.232642  ORF g.232642 m.232642 type:complete len:380 (+) comp12388_c0_seq1:3533-4672(+)
MSKTVVVDSPVGSASYTVAPSAKGQELFDMVLQKHQLREEPLYGVQYTDKKGYLAFLKLEKKIFAHHIQAGTSFQFRAQFYPENAGEELKSPEIQYLFYLQILDAIRKDEIYCPNELCVFFAALSLQITHGDFNEALHGPALVDVPRHLPPRVLAQHHLATADWQDRIVRTWQTQRGVARATAVLDLLTIAQDLEQYGVTYFEVTNKKGTKLWLGVHSLGMDIYRYNNKVTPQIGFPWNEIRNISFNDKKFRIKMTTGGSDFKFYAPRYRVNKRILLLCVGNHKLYMARRRNPAAYTGSGVAEDRAAVETKIRNTKTILQSIRGDLETSHDASKATREDQLHADQERQGLDKFKTMKKAQSGDANKRVTEFNNMTDSEA